jgi:hypothetical protein
LNPENPRIHVLESNVRHLWFNCDVPNIDRPSGVVRSGDLLAQRFTDCRGGTVGTRGIPSRWVAGQCAAGGNRDGLVARVRGDAGQVKGLTRSDGDVQATALRHAAGGAYSCSSTHPPRALRQMRRVGRAQDSRSAAPEKPDERVHLALDPTLAIVILQVEPPTSAAVETAKGTQAGVEAKDVPNLVEVPTARTDPMRSAGHSPPPHDGSAPLSQRRSNLPGGITPRWNGGMAARPLCNTLVPACCSKAVCAGRHEALSGLGTLRWLAADKCWPPR